VRSSLARPLHTLSLAAALPVLFWACGRTELDVGEAADVATPDGVVAAAPSLVEASPEGSPEASPEVAPPTPTATADPCADMPPVPCPGGGFEYCVAGHYSECPKRCAACVPGSQRVCFIAYCLRWGIQTCAADGLSFGSCRESPPPAACASLADQSQPAPALEQCCIDNGFCCEDRFDLNGDGNTSDQLGQCSGTTC
jgi:hypothetical protein